MKISSFFLIICLIFLILASIIIAVLIYKLNHVKPITITKQEQKIIEVSKKIVVESKHKVDETKIFLVQQQMTVDAIVVRCKEREKEAQKYLEGLE
jgi:hypothetical protein